MDTLSNDEPTAEISDMIPEDALTVGNDNIAVMAEKTRTPTMTITTLSFGLPSFDRGCSSVTCPYALYDGGALKISWLFFREIALEA